MKAKSNLGTLASRQRRKKVPLAHQVLEATNLGFVKKMVAKTPRFAKTVRVASFRIIVYIVPC